MNKLKKISENVSAFIEKEKLRPLVDVAIFVIIIYGFHLIWKASLPYFMNMDIYLSPTNFMKNHVFIQSSWFIKNILGIEFKTVDLTMYFPDNRYIAITSGCSGLKLFYEWIILMVLYPGPWRPKVWFIPLGLIVLHLLNLFRIVALAVIIMWKPDYWDFSHDYILRPFFYLVMFIMWMVWEEKFRIPVLNMKLKKHN